VLVTAAAGSGIGFATAKRCLEEGARVMVSDLHERRLPEAVERLRAFAPDRVAGKLCDVTSETDVRALVAAAIETLGGVDVLVNNAGLGGSAAVTDMTDEQWNKVLDVSLTSVFRMTWAMLPHMYARRSGAIVNNASLGWRAQALQAHYAAAKAGVMAFTRCAALEAADTACASTRCRPASPARLPNRVTSDELLSELRQREALAAPRKSGRSPMSSCSWRVICSYDRRGPLGLESARLRLAGRASHEQRSVSVSAGVSGGGGPELWPDRLAAGGPASHQPVCRGDR
jgi:3-oxoacyl-[acyl-carrier protein] reductase